MLVWAAVTGREANSRSFEDCGMQARLSWFPLASLRTVYRWCAGRELFYQTAAKAAAVDYILSKVALAALLAGIVCIGTQPLKISGPIWGLLLIVAPLAWRRWRWRMWLHASVAVGLLATSRSFSWLLIGLIVINLSTATLFAIENRLGQRWLFKPLYLGSTNVGSARLLRGRVEIAHLFLGTSRDWQVKDIRTAMKKVRSACRWLAKEGRRFSIHVDFTHRRISAADECWSSEVPSSKNGYADSHDFEQFLDRQLAAANWPLAEATGDEPRSNHCLMVHVAGWTDERAYAMAAVHGRADRRPLVEYVIVDADDSAATFAHELLHLFGADDFYFDGQFDKGWYAGQVGELLDAGRFGFLQRCVMFRTATPLRELAVDDQTAQKIGWL